MCIGMLNGNFSRYYNTSSVFHLLNPLCKILITLIYIIMVIMSTNYIVIMSLFIVILFVMNLSNIPLVNYVKPLLGMRVLFIFIIIINLIFGYSFLYSLMMIFKICLIVIVSSLLLFTTTTNDLSLGISYFLRPFSVFGFPVNKISMAIALSLNFIPNLFIQANKIIKSQRSRGFNYDSGDFKHRLLGLKSVFIPMFILSINKADSISYSLDSKNYSFDTKRNSIRGLRWYFNDVYALVVYMVLFVFVLVKEVVM